MISLCKMQEHNDPQPTPPCERQHLVFKPRYFFSLADFNICQTLIFCDEFPCTVACSLNNPTSQMTHTSKANAQQSTETTDSGKLWGFRHVAHKQGHTVGHNHTGSIFLCIMSHYRCVSCCLVLSRGWISQKENLTGFKVQRFTRSSAHYSKL